MEAKATKRVVQLDGFDEANEALTSKGVFFLSGEIDDNVTYEFTHQAFHAAATGMFNGHGMLVVLNTPGGDVQHGLAIYDTIKMLVEGGVHVDIFGLGLVASMGTIILQAGSRRLSSPYTQYLVHQVSMTIGYYESEEVSKGEERVAENRRLNDILLDIIGQRSGISIDELKKLCTKKDYWMDPQAARALGTNGLIDEVVVIPEQIKTLLGAKRA